jgi:hypothetical protein
MSRLRADEVLSKDALGPFLATKGINVPAGKNITFNDASEPTVLDGTSLTTSTLTLDQVNIGYNNSSPATNAVRMGTAQEFTIYHNNSPATSTIQTDKLVIRAKQGFGDPYITCTQGGSVELRYSGTPRFETTSSGIDISGDIASTYLSTDSSGITSTYLNTTSTGAAVTGTTTSTNGWAGTTSSAGILGGLAMAFSCGINGRIGLPSVNSTMVFGGSEFQGQDDQEGVVMPYAGKVYAATVHTEGQTNSLRLALAINGDITNTTNTLVMNGTAAAQNFSIIEDWASSPVTFSAGDRVNFRVSYTNVTQLEVVTVTFFVKFD